MGKKKERDAIVFLNEQMKLVSRVLSEWERGRLFEQLRAYSIEGILPDLKCETELYRSIFDMMRAAQDRAIEQYEATCQKNRHNALKRVQPVAAVAASGSDGSQYNIKENNIKESEGEPFQKGYEVEGVPGVVWA